MTTAQATRSQFQASGGTETQMPYHPEEYQAATELVNTAVALAQIPEIAKIIGEESFKLDLGPGWNQWSRGTRMIERMSDPKEALRLRVKDAKDMFSQLAQHLKNHPLSTVCEVHAKSLDSCLSRAQNGFHMLDMGTYAEVAAHVVEDLEAKLAGALGLKTMKVLGYNHDGTLYEGQTAIHIINQHDPVTRSAPTGTPNLGAS